jgi:pilus assembly protein CpaF
VVRLEARHANVEGRGAVTLEDLVRQALRMRPDRLGVGECRGAEVRDLLAALNTGHEGGCGTLHANAAADVMARLEALGSLAGMGRAAVAEALSLPVAAELRPEPGLAVAAERGEPPALRPRGPLRDCCRSLLSELLGAEVRS